MTIEDLANECYEQISKFSNGIDYTFDSEKFASLIIEQVEQTIIKHSNLFENREYAQVLIKRIKFDLGMK